jgi:phage tail-like protein
MISARTLYASHRFWVEIDGVTEGMFSECSGLQAEVEVFQLKEGGLNGFAHQLTGRARYSNITLKRGVASSVLWDWYYGVTQGTVVRRNLSVVLQSYLPKSGAAQTVRWNITGALPVKWGGPQLRSEANEIATETLELAHHGFVRA